MITVQEARVIHGDSIGVMRRMPEASIDAIVTDPPYGLGFMGKVWDDLPPGEEWARECLRVLKPGGHLLAFGGTRTWHRLAVAIEDAGFEIRDSIAWMYGEGMPKAKAVLKPAFEPVVIARRPFRGSAKANVEQYGTGGLNIDATRIGDEVRINPPGSTGPRVAMGDGWRADAQPREAVGRWPANVVLDEDQAAALDAQGGASTSRKGKPRNSSKPGDGWGMKNAGAEYDDQGGASRFFYCAKAPKNERPVVNGVAHPTVKPLSLMRWLVRLVTPPGGTVLDPFAGSGTTIEAAMLEGFSVIGVEREAEYLPLIGARIARATKVPGVAL